MAIVQNPVTGRSSGKLANIVFSTWKGINVMKAKPMPTNKQPSLLQVAQRDKFSAIMGYARTIYTLISWSFATLAVAKSSFNVFVSKNVNLIDSLTKKFAIATISDIQFAAGSMFGFIDTAISSTTPEEVSIRWDPLYMSPQREVSDKASVVIYNLEENKLYEFINGSLFTSGGFDTTSVGTTGDTCHVFLFTNKDNFSDSCDSMYVGVVTLS